MKTATERQAELLTLFVERMPMYIGEVSRKSIVDFMVGFECGSDCNRLWTSTISNHLEENYMINKVALGWPYQIEQLSQISNQNWEQAFLRVMKEILKNPVQ